MDECAATRAFVWDDAHWKHFRIGHKDGAVVDEQSFASQDEAAAWAHAPADASRPRKGLGEGGARAPHPLQVKGATRSAADDWAAHPGLILRVH
ncbi:hypothetical protein GQ85_11385 [Rhodococcus rhodochrous]|nr:hypothetical protein GQ85_11385 [Rhodococcus rhodochrous]